MKISKGSGKDEELDGDTTLNTSSRNVDNEVDETCHQKVENFEDIAPSIVVTTVDESSSSSSSQSTGSWDLAEVGSTTCSSGTQTLEEEDDETKSSLFRIAELEQLVSLQKSQIFNLEAEKDAQSKTIEMQKDQIENLKDKVRKDTEWSDLVAMKDALLQEQENILELMKHFDEAKDASNVTDKLEEDDDMAKSLCRIAELEQAVAQQKSHILNQAVTLEMQQDLIEKLKDKVDKDTEWSDVIAMEKVQLDELQEKIQELQQQLDESKDSNDVTVKFYEAEDEITKLREEKALACKVIQGLMSYYEAIGPDPVEVFNTLMKGSDVFELSRLTSYAQEYIIYALNGNPSLAIEVLVNNFENCTMVDQIDVVFQKCMERIRTNPSLLLVSSNTPYLSVEAMDYILNDPGIQTDELLLFNVLQLWYAADEEHRKEQSRTLAHFIQFEHIDPVQLSTTVRSSKLVSDSVLCDAYGKQAKDKSLGRTKRIRGTSKYIPATWDGTDSDVFSGDNSNPSRCSTGIVAHHVMDAHLQAWKMCVEEAGEILIGVVNASFNFRTDDVNDFGTFFPKRYFEKGTVVSCSLLITETGGALLQQMVNNKRAAPPLPLHIDSGMLPSVSVYGRAAVKFIGFARDLSC